MRPELLTAVVALQLLPIILVWLWLRAKSRIAGNAATEFAIAGRGLPLPVVAATLALTILGGPHIFGIFEMSWGHGATAIWFGVAHVAILCVLCLSTGQWARKLRLTTVPELLERMYSRNIRIATCCVMAGSIFGVLTLETQALGIILSSLTGWELTDCVLVGGAVGVLYILLSGMKGAGWMNLINAAFMYVALVLALFYLAKGLPGGNFDSVRDFYVNSGQGDMLKIVPSFAGIVNFALALFLILIFAMPINQVLLQTAMSAKSATTVKKALWIAAPLNGIFCVFTLVMGMTAKSMTEYAGMVDGEKVGTMAMLVQSLPPWLLVFLFASFFGVVLSSFAMVCLAPATIFAHDVYKRAVNPNASPERVRLVTRMAIVVLSILAILIATALPAILASIGWLLGWMMPIFFLVVVGLFWKCSARAAAITLACAWGINILWSVTPLKDLLGMEQTPNTYPILLVTFLIGILANLTLKGETAYFKSQQYLDQAAEYDAELSVAE